MQRDTQNFVSCPTHCPNLSVGTYTGWPPLFTMLAINFFSPTIPLYASCFDSLSAVVYRYDVESSSLAHTVRIYSGFLLTLSALVVNSGNSRAYSEIRILGSMWDAIIPVSRYDGITPIPIKPTYRSH